MDLIPIENIRYLQIVCQNENHIIRKNEKSLQFFFVKQEIQEKNKSIHIICDKCIKKQNLACCKVEEFKTQLNEILKQYHWNQILLNTKFETNITKTLQEIIYKEEFLFNGQPITALEIGTQQSSMLHQIHQTLNHQNNFKIIELFQQSFEILKGKVSRCFFDIFDEPQIKIEFKEIYLFYILIKEQNILIGHNQYDKKAIIYNYRNQRQIQFNVYEAILCWNEDFAIYQYNYKDNFLKIVELNSLQQKVLMKVESQIKIMKIVNKQLLIQYVNQDGIFIWNLNFHQCNQSDLKKILRSKISLHSSIIIENLYFYTCCNYLREIVDIRKNKVILRLWHRICTHKEYDQQSKISVFLVQDNVGYRIFIYNLACKRLIRRFCIQNYWCQVYHRKYLAYFLETMLVFVDIFNGQQILRLRLNIQEDQIRLNQNNYFHFRIKNYNYFWFNFKP